MDVSITGGIFLVAYALIASERLDRTLVALFAGLLLIVLGIVESEEAFAAVDLNVIFLLAGMMVLASALAQTGFFQWLAVRSVRMSRGDPSAYSSSSVSSRLGSRPSSTTSPPCC